MEVFENFTWATIRSLVFFGETQIKHVTGKTTHIKTPIVEPIKPKTSSMLGISNPISKEKNTIMNVKLLNFPSGM